MHFNLLGPLSVRDDEGPVELRGELRRTLLAALLLHAGAPVSADRLAECLWGLEGADADPARLHNHVTRLRLVLAGGGERIRSVPPGYQIRVEPGELDLHVFAAECAAGRRKLAEKAWAEAARHFGAALGLWRGRPLADIPALAEDPRIRELDETHLQALQGRIEAELNLGRHHELLDELHALTAQHPRHEAFHSQLILALHRAGRSQDATAVYEAYHESLLDELGLEPSAELRELHEAVLRADTALLLPPNPNAPRQLPADTRVFTGRTTELAELVTAGAKASGTLVISALDGLGGVGKTALAVHAAHRFADRFPDGQLFIDLRGHAGAGTAMSAGDALAYLLRSLGVPTLTLPAGTAERAELYRTRLAETRTLILLDNAAGVEQVGPLLPGEPGCLVLITSRNRLTELENARSWTVDPLSAAESVDLLVKVAGPRRALTGSPALRELAALCGHVPLALRIVASRLRHTAALTVEDLLAELRDEDARLERLTDGERDLTSVFDSSFVHLPEPEQRTLRLLGLLPGPDLDAFAAANLLETDTETAERLLESLLDHNLLIQQVEGRYGMHDLVRAYARSLVDTASDEAGAARERLLAYYQHATWTATRHQTAAIRWRGLDARFAGPSPELGEMTSATTWLRTERACLLAAVADPAVAIERRIDLALGLASLLHIDGPWTEATELQELVEREARALGDVASQADALRNLGHLGQLAVRPGSYDRAKESLERARDLYRRAGVRAGEADALFRTGRVLTYQGAYEAALAPEHEALALFREIGDRHGEALALQTIGETERMIGRNVEAKEACRQAVALHRELGNRKAEAAALQKLGAVQLDLGELHEALETLAPGLEIFHEQRQPVGEGSVLNCIGIVHTLQGSYRAADEALQRALLLFDSLDFPLGVAAIHERLGMLRTGMGDPPAGIEHLEKAHALYVAGSIEGGKLDTRRELGWARLRSGDGEGRAVLEQVLGEYRQHLSDPPGEVDTLGYLGRAHLEAGDPHTALGVFEETLTLARRIHRGVAEARALDGISRCREALDEREAALEALREAVALYERMGAVELAEARERLGAWTDRGEVSQPPAAEVS